MTVILILSGGRSLRMGQDKSVLKRGERTLLQWQVERFQQAGFEVVSGLKDQYADYPGPLAGIHAALLARPDVSNWFILPVDMPQFSVQDAEVLIQTGSEQQRLCCFERNPLPLFLPVNDKLIHQLEQWLEDPEGPRSVYALVQFQNGLMLSIDDPAPQLNNINTPEQWQTYLNGVSI